MDESFADCNDQWLFDIPQVIALSMIFLDSIHFWNEMILRYKISSTRWVIGINYLRSVTEHNLKVLSITMSTFTANICLQCRFLFGWVKSLWPKWSKSTIDLLLGSKFSGSAWTWLWIRTMRTANGNRKSAIRYKRHHSNRRRRCSRASADERPTIVRLWLEP